jgi:hypothetical protein
MSPSDLYSAALTALTNARMTMLTPEWQTALDASTPAQRLAASRELIQTQQAILALSNAQLSDIAAALQANDAALTATTSALAAALKNINQVAQVVNAVSSVLSTVAKIVKLL